MPTGQAKMADEVSEGIRSTVDRLLTAELTREVGRRGREIAAQLAQRSAEVGELASEAWRDAEPVRRDATKRVGRASRDAARWSERTWRSSLRPLVKDLWNRRSVAIGAAAAAVPVGREVIEESAQRLGIARREERRWGTFFLGLILGAVAGAVIALLTAPKPGREMRHELGARAEGVRDELASRARDAEWMPLFQREAVEAGNGGGQQLSGAMNDAAAEAGPITGDATEAADRAADETAEAINESFDDVEREALPEASQEAAESAEREGL